ncbi:MAG TPA: hypothetical protein VNY97_05720 [Candidatus Angelobacter sp.]|jgi:hypothetical protein|nr:hypothetical protein [Candidatus Angelobacter sp.]
MSKRSAVHGPGQGNVEGNVEAARKRPVDKAAGRDRSPRPTIAAPPGRGRPADSQPGQATARKSRAALARHSRRCNVCKHPDREAIELAFLRWRSPDDIAEEYGIAHHTSIYRHVHATGIFARRRQMIRLALDPLLERASSVKVTASAIISAARVYAQISEAGEWIRPAKTVIIHHVADSATPSSEPKPGNPNSEIRRLEHAPSN